MRTLRRLLYLICGLTDFAAFVVVFTVSREMAEEQTGPLMLGILGAGLSLSAAIASVVAGVSSQIIDHRRIFLSGAILIVLGIVGCAGLESGTLAFLASYWTVGIGLGFLYPPLIGWLNQGEDAHTNRRGVSRVLIIYCISWNMGMMCGQLTGGTLFGLGQVWAYSAALSIALLNLLLATYAASRVAIKSEPVAETTTDQQTRMELALAFKRLSWLANIGGMFGGSMVVHLLPDIAVKIGVQPDRHGSMLAGFRVVIISTYLVMHVLTFWHFSLSTAMVSQIVGAAGLVVIALAQSGGMLMIGLVMLGQLVGYNYFSGLYYSTAGSTNERRALAAGIHEATLAGGLALGTLVGGVLGSYVNARSPYWLAALCMFILIIVQTMAWRRWVLPLRRQTTIVDERVYSKG